MPAAIAPGCYTGTASLPVGRLVWQDVLGFVQHYKKQAR